MCVSEFLWELRPTKLDPRETGATRAHTMQWVLECLERPLVEPSVACRSSLCFQELGAAHDIQDG